MLTDRRDEGEVSRRHFRIVRVGDNARTHDTDTVVEEEPLEIRLNDAPLAVTMRTPGDDEALAIGFLVSEGIIRDSGDLYDVTRCAEPNFPDVRNIVNVIVAPERVPTEIAAGRQRYATSSCGLCGRATIETVRAMAAGSVTPIRVDPETLFRLPAAMRDAQRVFEHTGGLHAAALFDRDGAMLRLSEDVGRHNAVDKVIGGSLSAGIWPLSGTILMVSGRAGFEIVQKACAAGIPVVCSISAPSSLAVDLAQETGVMLVGFLRGRTMNVYAGSESLEP